MMFGNQQDVRSLLRQTAQLPHFIGPENSAVRVNIKHRRSPACPGIINFFEQEFFYVKHLHLPGLPVIVENQSLRADSQPDAKSGAAQASEKFISRPRHFRRQTAQQTWIADVCGLVRKFFPLQIPNDRALRARPLQNGDTSVGVIKQGFPKILSPSGPVTSKLGSLNQPRGLVAEE